MDKHYLGKCLEIQCHLILRLLIAVQYLILKVVGNIFAGMKIKKLKQFVKNYSMLGLKNQLKVNYRQKMKKLFQDTKKLKEELYSSLKKEAWEILGKIVFKT